MSRDVDLEELLRRWQRASAALMEAERQAPYSLEVDDIADEVIAARLALTQAGIRDIDALADRVEGQGTQLAAHAAVLDNALK